MRIGYSTWGMREVPIEKALPAIADLGFQGVELSVAPGWPTEMESLDSRSRHIIHDLLNEHGLVLCSVIRNASMVDEDPAANAANMQSLRDAIDVAAELTQPGETPVMVSHLGGRAGDWEAKRQMAVDRLGPLADYARDQGVVIGIEIHCASMLNLPERVVWLMETVNHPNVRINFDISHMEVMGIGIDESVPIIAPHSVHTHVKDQRGRYPDHEFLTPGEGPFDFAHYLRAMASTGYDGFITAEVSVMVQRRQGFDPFFHAQLAYWTLYKAFQVAGIDVEG